MAETNKIKEELAVIKKEAGSKISGYIVTALGLVAGLAWNDAVKSLIENFFPAKEQTVWAKFTYAALLTLIVVILSIYLVRLFNREDRKEKK